MHSKLRVRKSRRPVRRIKSITTAKEKIKRLRRRWAAEDRVRRDGGKKPLARPLEVAPKAVREEARKRGMVPFYHNGKKIEIPLVRGKPPFLEVFQGVYSVGDGKLYVLKSKVAFDISGISNFLAFDVLDPKTLNILEPNCASCFIGVDDNHLHLSVEDRFKGRGLATVLFERFLGHFLAHSKKEEIELYWKKANFGPVVENLDFAVTKKEGGTFKFSAKRSTEGLIDQKNNVNKWHSFQVINPRTGKVETIRLKVKRGK